MPAASSSAARTGRSTGTGCTSPSSGWQPIFAIAASDRGCTRAHVDTFSYQAKPFYERHGYEVFAVLDDDPPGHERIFLRK